VRKLLATVGPGILVAATGVGAGDLATATFAGSRLGTSVLWAVVVGAVMKLALTEGLARWQLATDSTLLEGVAARLGRWALWLFLPYFALWSFFVGSALISAVGVTLAAMVPVFGDPETGRIVFGVLGSAAGVGLVWLGGYALFSRVMGVAIAVMFAAVVVTAGLLWPGAGVVAAGLVPRTDGLVGEDLAWTVALIGGVGGTVTILCYGYWIREEGRRGLGALSASRLDLALGYGMTALFGLAMVVIGSRVEVSGRGAGLIVALADTLGAELGAGGRWVFLAGAFGAVFSSLLGVWQAVPYLFADLVGLLRGPGGSRDRVDPAGPVYRLALLGLATVPLLGLFVSFREVQKLYATVGALFVPVLALVLLVLNGRRAWVGEARNGPVSVGVLVATLAFFAWMAWAGLDAG
jgi:Mn2+/Fe2+ NRAMP family transporter